MKYMFSDDVIEHAFDNIGDAFGEPVKEGEITASMLYARDPSSCQRTWLNRLKRLVKEGKYTVRVAKQGELAFKPVDDGREDFTADS